MEKQHILDEIKRTAQENRGKPLGIHRFRKETGIRDSDWFGKYWARWGDALKEAGYSPNSLQQAYSDEFVLEKLYALIRELGHFPVKGEMILKQKQDKSFPSHNVFSRIGTKRTLLNKLITFCQQKQYADVVAMCQAELKGKVEEAEPIVSTPDHTGFVYLIKSGKYYKIGRTNAIGRREYEIGLQLPEKARLLHKLQTDDLAGIEAYWHKRFENKRANGEWFSLTAADISAFRRRKFM